MAVEGNDGAAAGCVSIREAQYHRNCAIDESYIGMAQSSINDRA